MQAPIPGSYSAVVRYCQTPGPILRIGTDSILFLKELQRVFLDLAQSRMQEFQLHTLPAISLSGISACTLRLIHKNWSGTVSRVLVTESEDGDPRIEWQCTPEEWDNCEGLLEGMLRANRPGHQYFTDGSAYQVLVEIAFRE